MTTSIIITTGLVALAIGALGTAAFVGLIIWIGLGEPDVNGDPEKDAGLRG